MTIGIRTNGYLTAKEADEMRHCLADVVERDALQIMQEYNTSCNRQLKISTVIQTAQQLRRATIFLWRTDLWRSALSGYELFQDKPFDHKLVTSPHEAVCSLDSALRFLQNKKNEEEGRTRP